MNEFCNQTKGFEWQWGLGYKLRVLSLNYEYWEVEYTCQKGLYLFMIF